MFISNFSSTYSQQRARTNNNNNTNKANNPSFGIDLKVTGHLETLFKNKKRDCDILWQEAGYKGLKPLLVDLKQSLAPIFPLGKKMFIDVTPEGKFVVFKQPKTETKDISFGPAVKNYCEDKNQKNFKEFKEDLLAETLDPDFELLA